MSRIANLPVEAVALKALRETLCLAQTAISSRDIPERAQPHVDRLGELIAMIDANRPLGDNGEHGDLHTPTCGCEDVEPPTDPDRFHIVRLNGDQARDLVNIPDPPPSIAPILDAMRPWAAPEREVETPAGPVTSDDVRAATARAAANKTLASGGLITGGSIQGVNLVPSAPGGGSIEIVGADPLAVAEQAAQRIAYDRAMRGSYDGGRLG